MRKRSRVLILCHRDLVPPDSIEGMSDEEIVPWKAQYDVKVTLEDMGHQVVVVGVDNELAPIRRSLKEFRPNIVFNLLEEFFGHALFDQHVASYLELLRQPYTGCNPRGLTLAHDKALSKKILSYHRIRVPKFIVAPMNIRPHVPKGISFPLIVKSLIEEGSLGISQRSLVHDADQLRDRIRFVHRRLRTHAIAEEFINGRELYVGVLGNQRLTAFPPWELSISKLASGRPLIATDKVKWDYSYQDRVGVKAGRAKDLSPRLQEHIEKRAKRIYRLLDLTGYARLDFRLTPEGELFLIEANPNPDISYGDYFAEAADAAGLSYEELLAKIMSLGRRYLRNMSRSCKPA